MGWRSKFTLHRKGAWRLLVHRERWTPELWPEILHHVETLPAGDRPAIYKLRFSHEQGRESYLKTFPKPSSWRALKDVFRDSNAFRGLKLGEALADLGFSVPVAIAAGEERYGGLLGRAFLLTMGTEGPALAYFLQQNYSARPSAELVRKKREGVKQLALEVQRMHKLGFVHGDLTPFNILVQADRERARFFYVDNDRTRRYPSWLRQRYWRRNLVQLNRFLLPGITLQDRVRFLCVYLGRPTGSCKADRRLVRWLEEKTRSRIRDWDPKEPKMNFRKLMQWTGSFDRNG